MAATLYRMFPASLLSPGDEPIVIALPSGRAARGRVMCAKHGEGLVRVRLADGRELSLSSRTMIGMRAPAHACRRRA